MNEVLLKRLDINAEKSFERLDRFLATSLPDFTRNRLQKLIKAGQVTLNGATIIEASQRVNAGDQITLDIPKPIDAQPKAEHIPLDVVYEDQDLIVINKSAGMVVHPAPGNTSGTLVNALIAHCGDSLSGIGGQRRPGIVHRLDKDTSGLLVVAKNDAAHQGLARQFAAHGRDGKLTRTYTALVWGIIDRPHGTVDAPLGRSPTNRLKQAVINRGGKRAITHFQTVETFTSPDGKGVATLLSCRLETGRTHQIRVHMHHIGHPLLGDPLYAQGFKTKAESLSENGRNALHRMNRQALHAGGLSFLHPRHYQQIELQCSMPDDLHDLIDRLRQPRS